jgi:hypothetical protein
MLLGYKPVHVTVLNTGGNCNSVVSTTILYYIIIILKIGSGFATVRFTTIQFYDPSRVESSIPDSITVATQVLSVLSALLTRFQRARVSSFSLLVQFF